PETFSPSCVPGQKRYRILTLGSPVWPSFRNVTQPWPQSILFGQAGSIILRGNRSFQLCQSLAVVPWHPSRRTPCQVRRMSLQLAQIVEWIGVIQLAGVNQAHKQVTDGGAVHRLVEKGVLAIENRFLQSPFYDVVVDRRACLLQEKRQLGPMIQQVGECF